MVGKRFLWALIFIVILIYFFTLVNLLFLKGLIKNEMLWIILGVLIVTISLYFRFRSVLVIDRLRKDGKQEIQTPTAMDKKYFEDAVRRQDIKTLWNMVSDYEKRWIVDDYIKILRTIHGLDPEGVYGKEAIRKLKELDKPIAKRFLKEIQTASKKVIINPKDYAAWIELGDSYMRAELYEDARNIFDQVLQLSNSRELEDYANQRLRNLRGVKGSTPLTKDKE